MQCSRLVRSALLWSALLRSALLSSPLCSQHSPHPTPTPSTRQNAQETIGDTHGKVATLEHLALSHLALGAYQEAVQCLQAQQDTAREVGFADGEASAAELTGKVYERWFAAREREQKGI